VSNKVNGIPFLSSSDILQADLENVKYASKKYTPCVEQMTIQKGWTLISRSGTIGNCAFANAKHAQKLASEDVIRLVPNNILREGVIYAFLASKYGHSLLTQGTFGAVIQHIEPAFVESLHIPVFPEEFQKEIDELIQSSAQLRVEAIDSIDKAHEIIDKFINFVPDTVNHQVSIKDILSSHTKRFEGAYYSSENHQVYNHVSQMEHTSLKNWVNKIFRPGIFKRQYVKDGVTFLGGADILLAIPDSEKKLSFKQVEQMPELTLKEGWILVTCGGTIGNTVYVDKQLSKCAVSQHVIRIVPKEGVKKGFLYAFLSSKVGYKLITRDTYGSVIPQIEPHHIERIPIPQFPPDLEAEIDELVMTYANKLSMSKSNERKAISMVEQEIEKWNK
jgi:type I restriction enzyme S subunit